MKRMEKMLLLVCLLYWGMTAVSVKWKREGFLPFGLLGGWMVAFFCFCFLPPVFEGKSVIAATACALLGTLLGTWAEKKGRRFWEAAGFTAAALAYSGLLWHNTAVFAALGGFCLYLACGAVLPEGRTDQEALWHGLTGVLGFIAGIFCCFP